MKKQSLYQAMALVLASSLLGACTHVVVTDPANEQNDFLAQEGLGDNSSSSTLESTKRPPKEERLDPKIVANPAVALASASVEPVLPAVPAAPLAAAPAPQPRATECDANQAPYFNKSGMKTEEIKIRANGYGAPPKAFYSDAQRRLMSMRAAKIDAYRSLAERVKGVQIWGGTTIGDMVVENDRFRVFLDTYLVGAKLIMQTPHEDGSYEATVEMVVGQQLVKDLVDNRVMQAPAAGSDCVEPASRTMHTRDNGNGNIAPSSRVAKSDFYFDRE